MKKLVFPILFFLAFISLGQNKTVHYSSATIEAKSESIQSFLNENYIVLFGINEIKPGYKQYSVTWSDLSNKLGSSHSIEPMQKENSKFFGFHFNGDVFNFFEEHIDASKIHIITLHSLHLGRFKAVKKEISKDKSFLASRNYRFVHNKDSDFSFMYSLNEDTKGQQFVKVMLLDAEYNNTGNLEYKFKTKVDKEFNWVVSANSAGDVYAIHQVKNEKEKYVVSHYFNVFEKRDSDTELKFIYKDKSFKIDDFRVSIDDNSVVSFFALGSVKNERTSIPKIVRYSFHPNKELTRQETEIPLKMTGNLSLSQFLPLNDEFTIVVLKSSGEKQISNSASAKGEMNSKSTESLQVCYIHNVKGLLWQEQISLTPKEADPMINRMFSGALSHYFWSDGKSLYAFYYAEMENDTHVPNRTLNVGQEQMGVNLIIRKFDLSTGKSKTSKISLDENAKGKYVLPVLSKLTSLDYIVAVLQTEATKAYPIQIRLNN